jgi:hypothetical protein
VAPPRVSCEAVEPNDFATRSSSGRRAFTTLTAIAAKTHTEARTAAAAALCFLVKMRQL